MTFELPRGVLLSCVGQLSCVGLLFATGCGDDTPNGDEPDAGTESTDVDAAVPARQADLRYEVGGVVDGLSGTVIINLSVESTSDDPRGDEALELEQGGAFSFRRTLVDGDEYEVTVIEQPEDDHCTVEDGNGVIDGESVLDILVYCEPGNPGIQGLALSAGQLDPEFSSATTRYRVDVPLWTQRIEITPDAVNSDIEVTIAETRYRGEPIAFDLDLGQNTVEVTTLAENGEQRSYVVDIYRASRVVEEAYGKADAPAENAHMGYSMSLDGDLLAVGAPNQQSFAPGINGDEGNFEAPQSGAVYIFSRDETGWKQEAFIKPENSEEQDLFGYALALHENRLVVGAPWEQSSSPGVDADPDDNDSPQAGAVYVFERDGSSWEQVNYIKSHDPRQGDNFGHAVSIQRDGELAGQRLVVGAYQDTNSAVGVNPGSRNEDMPASGAAYVFELRDGGWTQTAYIKASNADPGDLFGSSIDISNDVLVVGAIKEQSDARGLDGDQNNDDLIFAGASYVFEHDEDNDRWLQTAYLKASNTAERQRFGHAVSVDGDTIAIGAYTESSAATRVNGNQDDTSAEEAGAVYIFDRAPEDAGEAWQQTAYVKASNSDVMDRFGYAVALRSNVLVVGAIGEASAQHGVGANQGDNDSVGVGAVYVYSRLDDQWSQQVYIKATNADGGDSLGFSLGFDGTTLAAGAPYEDSAIGGVEEEGGSPNNVTAGSGAVYWFR
jgi:hypothetical protein